MKTYEELSAEFDEATAGMTADQLACDLAEHGIKFDNPSPAIQAAMDEFDAKNPPDDGWPTACPCCGAEWEYRLTGGMGYKCNSTWIERTNETDRAGNCYERQISAILEDKPTATEFERVCTSNHQLERELAQLRYDGGIKDGRIAEIGEEKEVAINRLAEQMHRADELQKRLTEIAVTALTIDGESASNYALLKAKARIAELEAKLDAVQDWEIYAAKVIGGDSPYEQRTEWMEGWNACAMAAQKRIIEANTNACLLKEESK